MEMKKRRERERIGMDDPIKILCGLKWLIKTRKS
jgi:hypothetical protein